MSGFKRAVKAQSFLRLALAGPAGSGKTYTALTLATALADGKPVAVIDTEHGSATKYADLFGFDALELAAPFSPDRYIEAIHDAESAGYAVLVIDSLTHAWDGAGGLIEIVGGIAKRKYGGNTFAAWAEGTPIQTRFIEAILASRLHIIATMRTKSDYSTDKDERTGKTSITKVGTAVKQRDGVEYEFDIFARMTLDNEAIIEKTRCSALAGAIIRKPGKPMAETLRTWLTGEPMPALAATATPPATRPTAPTTTSAETGESAPDDAPAPEPMTLSAIHATAAKVGLVPNADQWDAFCVEHTGKRFADIKDTKDAEAKAKLQAAVLAATDYDLRALPTGNGRH